MSRLPFSSPHWEPDYDDDVSDLADDDMPHVAGGVPSDEETDWEQIDARR